MGHHQLDSLDYKILKLIASNARIPFLEVARECNVSGAAIHQRGSLKDRNTRSTLTKSGSKHVLI